MLQSKFEKISDQFNPYNSQSFEPKSFNKSSDTSNFNRLFMDSDFFHKESKQYESRYDDRVKVWQINEALDKDFTSQRNDYFNHKIKRSKALINLN